MTQRVQSIERAMSILGVLGDSPDGLQVSQIATLVDLNKSTVSRILYTLMQGGFVQQRQDRSYQIGLRILDLSSRFYNSLQLKTEALPHLERLRDETGMVVHLGMLQDDHVVYLDKISEFANMRMYSMIGKRAYCHCTGLGKAIMSQLPDEQVDHIIETVGLHVRTAFTITDPDVLRADLAAIRARGFSIDEQENEENVRCIAAPIFDYAGNAIAAVSATGFALHTSMEDMVHNAQFVITAAQAISVCMGYRPEAA